MWDERNKARFTISWIWLLNLRLGSIITPKSVILSEFDMTTLFRLYDIGMEREPSSKIWHLEYDIPSCHVVAQKLMWSRWIWNCELGSVDNSVYNFKSSANILILVLLEKKSAISFINKLNKSGPKTLPWGTPLVTSHEGDIWNQHELTEYDLIKKL